MSYDQRKLRKLWVVLLSFAATSCAASGDQDEVKSYKVCDYASPEEAARAVADGTHDRLGCDNEVPAGRVTHPDTPTAEQTLCTTDALSVNGKTYGRDPARNCNFVDEHGQVIEESPAE